MISNALLFDSKLLSDHFTPWSSPYHLLHPFMQPIMPTTILVLRKNIFYSLGGAWAWNLKFEQLGPHREKQQNLEKQKTQAKPKKTKKKLLGECLVLTQTMFFLGVPSFFCCFLVLKWKTQNNIFFCFLNGYDQSRSQKTTNNSSFFFNIFGLVFCIEKSQKQKQLEFIWYF